jgi:PAS domain S-box-containing protein
VATVLVVDDVATNRDLAAMLLGYRGHTVIEAASGEEALDRVHDCHPDVVVSDVLMPGMDGLELVHRLRADADPLAAHAPVIFYTANYLELETRPIAEAFGVSQVVLRGSDPQDLLAAVDRALRAGPVEIPAESPEDFARAHAQALQANLMEKVRVLRHTERQFEAMTAASPIGIALLDAAAEAVYVNDRLAEITGKPMAELLGDGWLCCLEPPARNEATRLLSQPPDVAIEHRYRTRVDFPDASSRWLRVHLRPYRDTESGISGAVAVIDDITDVVEAEERASREAARRADDARRLDLERLESLRRMAGGIAHDFNNLLGAMLGFLQLASEAITEEAAAGRLAESTAAALLGDLGNVATGGERAAKLTEQLLAFGRRDISQSASIDLNAFIRAQDPELPDGIALDLRLAEGTAPIVIAPDALERLLKNLVQNACEAMPAGGTVTITSAFDSSEPPQAVLTVTDTGLGMTPETLGRAFEPFYSTKQSLSSGLGLSTVHGIASQAGGEIWLESREGAGTTATVRLPVTPVAPVSPPVARRAPSDVDDHRTVLLVDDDSDLRQVVARFIGKAGYQVLVAADGPEALDIAARHQGPIHCLVSDVVMPGMDGRQLAHRLLAERPETAVVFISGYAEALIDEEGRSLEPGATILGKPFTSTQLHEALSVVLASR